MQLKGREQGKKINGEEGELGYRREREKEKMIDVRGIVEKLSYLT